MILRVSNLALLSAAILSLVTPGVISCGGSPLVAWPGLEECPKTAGLLVLATSWDGLCAWPPVPQEVPWQSRAAGEG